MENSTKGMPDQGNYSELNDLVGKAVNESSQEPALPNGTDLPDEFSFLNEGQNRGQEPEVPSSPAMSEQSSGLTPNQTEKLGKAFIRKDPSALDDPFPKGNDSVVYSTYAVSSGNEAGLIWPELISYRMSDDFPEDDLAIDGEIGETAPASTVYGGEYMENQMMDTPAKMAFPDASSDAGRRTNPKSNSKPKNDYTGNNTQGADQPSTPSFAWLEEVDQSPEAGAVDVDGLVSQLNLDSFNLLNPDVSNASGVKTNEARPEDEELRSPIKDDFPALNQKVNGHPLIWLDNGATTQKPNAVIEAVSNFYKHDNSNVHRGAHELAARATDAYENAREIIRRFLGAESKDEIVFVRGTTEGINLVAESWGIQNIGSGDEILLSQMEHHANIVPWQHLRDKTGAKIKVIPSDDDGNINMDHYASLLGPQVKLVSLTHVSNVLGTVLPVCPMARMAKEVGAKVLIDGAQSVAHVPVNVQAIDADFFVFSGHKIYGPTGIGALYAKKELLDSMPPWQGGGSMIKDVTFEQTIYSEPPAKFEAGTPNLAGAVGLGAALEYFEKIGRGNIFAHEQLLMKSLESGLRNIPGLQVLGNPHDRAGAISFILNGYTPEEVGAFLNSRGIALRSGHHCAQPILRKFGLESSVRPALGIYNDEMDIHTLLAALREMPMRS